MFCAGEALFGHAVGHINSFSRADGRARTTVPCDGYIFHEIGVAGPQMLVTTRVRTVAAYLYLWRGWSGV